MSMKRTLIACAALTVFLCAVSGWFLWQAHSFLHTPAETPGREVVVHITPGETFDEAASALQADGVITDAWRFRLLARLEGKAQSIKAGEFSLHSSWTPRQVLDALTEGRAMLHKLFIPEGLPWWKVARVVEESGLTTAESFEKAIHDKDLLRSYNIPFDSAEGFLYPETYLIPRPRGGDAAPIVRTMLSTFWEQAGNHIWPNGPPSEDELKRIVTLASMVEKETAAASERARIAGVYTNRLRRGMRMQCDPTVIYGLGTAFDGNITKKHLRDSSNPYNTYRHKGLPPGPICSPGRPALEAAMQPEKHKYIFFVSKGDGTHKFSRTLREHNRAVRRYLLRR